MSASRGINIQRLILAEIVAVLSAPLLVLGSKGLLRPATNALAMPKSSDKVHPLLAAIGAGRTGKQAICVWEGGVQQGEQRLIGADLLAAGFQQQGGDIRGVVQAFADAEGHGHLVDDEQEFSA